METMAIFEEGETHPDESVTVNVPENAERPTKTAEVPDPAREAPLGRDALIVHEPEAGNPLNATLPVEVLHVGCVIVPIIGAEGFAFTFTFIVPAVLTQPFKVAVTE